MKGLNMRMYDYRGKIAGVMITAVSAILLTIQRFTHFVVLQKYTALQHYYFILFFVLFGLYMMANSREKMDDERVKLIRAKAFQTAFNLTVTILLAVGVSSVISSAANIDGKDLMFIGSFALVIYLGLFHAGLYFDNTWEYEEDKSWIEAVRKNWIYKIAVTVIFVVVIVLLGQLFMLK